jgi:hypothetical protein
MTELAFFAVFCLGVALGAIVGWSVRDTAEVWRHI